MTTQHGKDTAVTLGGVDLSVYSSNIVWGRTADKHDLTTFGKDAHVYRGGLLDGTATITGFYDTAAAAGPKAIEAMLGTVVELVYMPEGTGTGLPEKTVDALVENFTETSPVADYVSFSIALQLSDDVAITAQ